MNSLPTTSNAGQEVLDTVSEPRHPFGLPLGSIRGFMSLMICAFFWMVLLWPEPYLVRPLLAHFFLLALVLLVFSPYSSGGSGEEGGHILPRLLRILFIGGSVAVVAYIVITDPERLGNRLTPDPAEFRDWWGPFLAVMAGAFAAGKLLRLALGRENPLFQTLRAWLSVVGLLMLAAELIMWVSFASAERKPEMFIHYWQAFELAFISAYFGTRA